MYYLRLNDAQGEGSQRLTWYCRHCGHEDNNVDQDAGSVLSTNINKRTDRYDLAINEFTKLDPTLPRSRTIKCPTTDCDSTEVIYIRYDRKNIKFLYHCPTCSSSWTTSQR